MGEKFVTSIHLYDEFYVNLLFEHSIYRPMCTHMGNGGMGQAPLAPLQSMVAKIAVCSSSFEYDLQGKSDV